MNRNQKGYILMTNCERFLRENNGTYQFVTDPFEAKFINIDEALELVDKAFEMWGEQLVLIPTERTITLLG